MRKACPALNPLAGHIQNEEIKIKSDWDHRDSGASKQNTTRAAAGQGWDIAELRKEADEYCLLLWK